MKEYNKKIGDKASIFPIKIALQYKKIPGRIEDLLELAGELIVKAIDDDENMKWLQLLELVIHEDRVELYYNDKCRECSEKRTDGVSVIEKFSSELRLW